MDLILFRQDIKKICVVCGAFLKNFRQQVVKVYFPPPLDVT
jgi:hypothetical protein